jgi:hypothetical protein
LPNKKVLVAVLLGTVALAFGMPGATGTPAVGRRIHPVNRGAAPSVVHRAADFAVSKPLRSFRSTAARTILDKTWADHSSSSNTERKREKIQAIPHSVPNLSLTDPQVTAHAPLVSRIPVSSGLSTTKFPGVSKASATPTEFPPDPNGAVGPNDYVEMVNSVVAVSDKSGNPQGAPAPIGSFWNTLGGPCGNSEDGDPVVLRRARGPLVAQ